MSRPRNYLTECIEAAGLVSGNSLSDLRIFSDPFSEHPPSLHFQPVPTPWLWWSEQGQHGISDKPVDAEKCLLRFCGLGSAADAAICDFAREYGILGIWPARVHMYRKKDRWSTLEGKEWDQQCGLILHQEDEQTSDNTAANNTAANNHWHMVNRKSFWNKHDITEWRFDPDAWEIPPTSDRYYLKQYGLQTWYGEPLDLWRRIATHLRTLLLIAASLQSGKLVEDEQWASVCEPMFRIDQENIESDPFGWTQHPGLTILQVQQLRLAYLCSRWMRSIHLTPLLDSFVNSKGKDYALELQVGIHFREREDQNWQRDQYLSCNHEQAWERDLRKENTYTNVWEDQVRMNTFQFCRVTMRSSRLFNLLILELASMIAGPMRVCSVCMGPAPGLHPPGPDGFRRRTRFDRGVQCSDDCRREASLEAKRRSFHKNKSR